MVASQRDPSLGSLLLSLVVLAGFAPVAEELFFRGYVQTRLEERFGAGPAIAVTSLLFGLFHMNLPQGVFAGFFGLLVGWVAWATRSVRISIAVHAVNNAVFVLSIAIGIGRPSGLARLIENAVAAAIALGCGVMVVRRMPRPV
jgi:membrane protease YdiL (CAAX protease family)